MKKQKQQSISLKNSKQKGFTLVELMVSLMLFTIVVLSVVGSLYSVNDASRKAQAMRSALDNLNFALESMSRTIRTGSDIVCGGSAYVNTPNCPFEGQNPGYEILINSTLGKDELVQYRFIEGRFGGVIEKSVKEAGVWGNWVAITAPEIDVDELSFYVEGAETSDQLQPSVMIFIKGVARAGKEESPFAVQTYISQRAIE